MIYEEEFTLEDIWHTCRKREDMTLRERKELESWVDMLPEAQCRRALSCVQQAFVAEVLPWLFRTGVTITPEIVRGMGLSMEEEFRYESEPYSI